MNPCKIDENNTVINCTGIIIDNIDINANYSIGLIIDSSELYKDQNLTEKELEFTKSGSSVMIKDRSRLDLENLYFKITEYISADELKPIIVPDNNPVVVPETKPVVVSTTPNNVVAKANIVSPIATVRTGGNNLINLQLSFILVLSVLINYKVKKIIN